MEFETFFAIVFVKILVVDAVLNMVRVNLNFCQDPSECNENVNVCSSGENVSHANVEEVQNPTWPSMSLLVKKITCMGVTRASYGII